MSWQAIAHALADRLAHNDPCSIHVGEPQPDDCPFCADVDALRLYVEKVKSGRDVSGIVTDLSNTPVGPDMSAS